jgi:hypothetical protein
MSIFRTFSSFVALVACGLCSCTLQDENISQIVTGRLINDGPATPGAIKVLSWSEGDCAAGGVTSTVSGKGEFSLTRTVTRGRLAVVVQHDLICYRQSGPWEFVWQSGPYGPAAESLTVECTKTAAAWKCSVVTNWGTDVADAG